MLTHRLLAFSSRQSLQSQAIDLRALLTPDALAAKLGAGIELQVRLATQLWVANADGEQLQASLDNLLRNACEAMPSGGVLSVEADNVQVASDPPANAGLARGDYLCLSIRDSGQGMSQATLEHAIEPFFTTKPTGQGVGLGLSMVYGFSRQSRGYLTLDSQIGKGTRVRLYLPRHTDSQPQLGTAPPRPASDCQDILLVEDDPDVRELVERTLEEEGYPCRATQNASEALRWLHSAQPFGLMISDVGLPGMNGRQLAEIARRLRPGLPVLFITGFAQTAMARDAFLATGCSCCASPSPWSSCASRSRGCWWRPEKDQACSMRLTCVTRLSSVNGLSSKAVPGSSSRC
jgi:CheY-like chemotaxis protein